MGTEGNVGITIQYPLPEGTPIQIGVDPSVPRANRWVISVIASAIVGMGGVKHI